MKEDRVYLNEGCRKEVTQGTEKCQSRAIEGGQVRRPFRAAPLFVFVPLPLWARCSSTALTMAPAVCYNNTQEDCSTIRKATSTMVPGRPLPPLQILRLSTCASWPGPRWGRKPLILSPLKHCCYKSTWPRKIQSPKYLSGTMS